LLPITNSSTELPLVYENLLDFAVDSLDNWTQNTVYNLALEMLECPSHPSYQTAHLPQASLSVQSFLFRILSFTTWKMMFHPLPLLAFEPKIWTFDSASVLNISYGRHYEAKLLGGTIRRMY